MLCEKCKKEHDGEYGSGRFCTEPCARSFSTFEKREEISKKVSEKLKGTVKVMSKETCINISKAKKRIHGKKIKDGLLNEEIFNNLGLESKRRAILLDQDKKRNKCGISNWMSNIITLELEHIDGNSQNNTRENLEFLCPNCHSQTLTWRGRNKSKSKTKKRKVSDETLLLVFKKEKNIRQTLLKLGLAAKGDNYNRVKKLIENVPL